MEELSNQISLLISGIKALLLHLISHIIYYFLIHLILLFVHPIFVLILPFVMFHRFLNFHLIPLLFIEDFLFSFKSEFIIISDLAHNYNHALSSSVNFSCGSYQKYHHIIGIGKNRHWVNGF